MPIYEFICEECKNEFEEICNFRDKIKCPKCNSKNIKRKLSVFAFKSGANFKSSSPKENSCTSCSASSCSSCKL